ncbi:FAD:protein FMN transferase [Bordetella sp. BOR01]|uniref:FAD:protein FMN transferase n=1 Tax=Bordetella sp. BOR01 TaxID=2854779 RepID=UPI001C485A97|nr:FAD:protein FMN transferase [Bordetella sp. BOR01]MBV7486785.1 FAD:protein FMN transferase [Bordetella sp. BOR01]
MPSYAPAGPGPASIPRPAARVPAGYGAVPPVSVAVPAASPAALAGATMGTTWSARLALPPGVTAQAAQAAIQQALGEVVAQMSTWDDTSDLSRYNRAEPGWQALPVDCFHVLRHALALAADTGGAYDPTVGPLVNAWGFGPPPYASEPPQAATLQAARQRCGWQRIRLDESARRAWQPGGTYLDLSAIAKGYAVDHAARALDRLGLAHYLVEAGGELRARGHRPDGEPWRVAIEVPDGSDDHALALPLQDRSIATSGDYRRYRHGAAGRYAHTVDPRTGHPVDNGVASVTIVHKSCMQADALATALTVLGARDGLAYAHRHGLAALFIVRAGQQLRLAASDAFAAIAST